MGFAERLQNLDFYRKIPEDLSKGTLSGASLSLLGTLFMGTLFVLEFNSFLTVRHDTRVVIDESTDEMMQINFNITLPRLPCAFTNLDVEDLMGVRRENLTTGIRKFAVDHNLNRIREVQSSIVAPRYEDMEAAEPAAATEEGAATVEAATDLTEESFPPFLKDHKVVLVNYFAPWCHWSRKLNPIWDKAAAEMSKKPWGHKVALGKVDCTKKEVHKLCHSAHINAFPTVLVYRDGHSHTHEMYQGHRTVEALVEFAQSLVGGEEDKARRLADQPEDQKLSPQQRVRLQAEAARSGGVARRNKQGPEGCNIAGFLMVNRVPGNFHIHAHNPGYSFRAETLNVSHIVNHLSFGSPLTQEQYLRLPESAAPHADRFAGRIFSSSAQSTVFEHYVKVVANTFRFRSGDDISTFKYTASSHHYDTERKEPMVLFKYDLSPMSVLVEEVRQPTYHFLTNVCAIIGGVFTVIGLVDSLVYHGINTLSYKMELGKHR